MNKNIMVTTKTVSFDEKNNCISSKLLRQLTDFLVSDSKYHTKMANDLFNPERSGEMAVFFNAQEKLIGFIRIIREPFSVRQKEYTLSTAAVHLTAGYSLEKEAARFFFMQSMKYKLSHPQEDLMHIALVNNPEDYHFITRFCTQVYPKANSSVPDPVLKLAHYLKNKKNWRSATSHPLVIQFRKNETPQEKPANANKCSDFYQKLNPFYHQGDSVLTCVPLSVTNLCYGIKQLVSMPA